MEQQIKELKRQWEIFQTSPDRNVSTEASYNATKLIFALREAGMSNREISEATGIKESTVINRAKPSSLPQALRGSLSQTNRPNNSTFDRVVKVLERASAEELDDAMLNDLEDELDNGGDAETPLYLPDIDMENDIDIWEKARTNLLKTKRYVKIMFGTDIHFPFHSKEAMSIYFQIMERFKPDIVPMGSDMFNLDNLSVHWGTDPDHISKDPIMECMSLTKKYTDFVKYVNPRVLMPFLDGNHDVRFLTYLTKNAPALRDWNVHNFSNQLIRGNGILWRGFNKPKLKISDTLRIDHGDLRKFARNENYAVMNNKKFDTDCLIGDKHRSQSSHWTMETRHKSFYGVGTLGTIFPEYNERDEDPAQHQHGFALITVDTSNMKNYVENIFIDSFSFTTMWGGHLYSADPEYYI